MRNKRKSTSFEKERTRSRQEQYTPFLKELSRDTQLMDIMKHLIKHGSITQMEAVDMYRCYRLSARIADLRDMDIDIVTIMQENEHNSGHHARYFLEVKE